MGWFTKDETESTEASKQGVWSTQLGSAVAEARKAGVGTKKGSKKIGGNAVTEESGGSVPVAVQEAAKKMFDPEAWRAIVRAPFALGQALTGRKCWELEKKQEDTLAVSTSATAEYFLQTDPKWVCLTIFAFNWSVIMTEKLMLNAREREKELALEPKKEQPALSGLKPVNG